MAETLTVAEGGKEEKYSTLYRQICALNGGEDDIIARMANTSAAISSTFGFLWCGFYRVAESGGELVLGPFQGPIACTRIPYGKGVCGSAWAEGKTLVVPDVNLFPGHIRCSSMARSEIVVPVLNGDGEITAVLDIDSAESCTFDGTDASWLEMICRSVATGSRNEKG